MLVKMDKLDLPFIIITKIKYETLYFYFTNTFIGKFISKFIIKDYKKILTIISEVKSLKGLKLYHNNSSFVQIPPEIGLSEQLESLELYFYGGCSLPKEISKLKKLKHFGFSKYIRSGLEYLNKDCEVY